MTYTHLTTDELVLIESYYHLSKRVTFIADDLKRSRQMIYNVYNALNEGTSALDYYHKYKGNKKKCGRHPISLPKEQKEYIQEKVAQGWTPDVIIGRAESPIACSVRTLYRLFRSGCFDLSTLPMKGKRKPNGHKEKRGKQAFKRTIHQRNKEYDAFNSEFGHLEGDTIVGKIIKMLLSH